MAIEPNKYEISLMKIREGQMKFVAAVFKFSEDYLNEEYPEGNAKGFVRNSPDGCYEIFAVIEEE